MLFVYIVLMVPSSALVVPADGECLSYGGFSLGETIRFESHEFIADRFSGLTLHPLVNGSGTVVMGPAIGGPLFP
jgi:hypothetical protein